MQVNPGDRFGRYEVVSRLGAGGMGEVYFASDTKLGRPVALKLLPPELTEDGERLRRFEREARLTSSISHPNLLTVYDIGEENSAHYIAAEFIDGETLRSRMKSGPLAAREALAVGEQIAEALAAAHEAGVIHRDVKPENVMLRPDRVVKVLDFGLAKLASATAHAPAGSEVSTASVFETGAGTLLGTVLYMSPEQLRGQETDGRADIWSLGCVLYEMLVGQPPFDRSTRSDAIASILGREPAPIACEQDGQLAAELQRVVSKCLRKDRNARYRSMSELARDLKSLRRRAEETPDDPRFEIVGPPAGALDAGARATAGDRAARPLQTGAFEGARETSAVAVVRRGVKSRRALIFASLVCVALVGGTAYSYLRPGPRPAGRDSQRLEFSRLAVAGVLKDAAISPDGRYVAFVAERPGGQSLRVRQVNTSADLQIDSSPARYGGITFSPDGDYVFFRREEETGVLYRVPVIGGEPRRIAARVDTPVAVSPDGRQLAFVRGDEAAGTTVMIVAAADGSGERPLAVLRRPQSFNLAGLFSSGPAWSPDGKTIVCPAFNLTGLSRADIAAVSVADGAVRALNTQSWAVVEKIVWLSDGSGVVMNAEDKTNAPLQLWLLSYPSGEARRITDDPNYYTGLSAAHAAGQLLAMKREIASSMWVAPADGRGGPARIASSEFGGLSGVAWTPDGRIVYVSNESGAYNVWIMNADGGARRQLTFGDDQSIEPAVSPDGRRIVFVKYQSGKPHVWIAGADGSGARQLTDGDYEDAPAYTPDGRFVVYHAARPEGGSLWRIPVDGGEATLLVRGDVAWPDVSPDGKLLAYFLRVDEAGSRWRVAVAPADGGRPLRTFDLPASVTPSSSALRFSPDGTSVTYAASSGGASDVWAQPLSGGRARRLTDFREGQVFSFAWSARDGRLVCARGTTTASLYLVRNFGRLSQLAASTGP